MTDEELQEMNAKIQGGYKDEKNYPLGNRLFRGRWYYHEVIINDVKYSVNTKRQIINV